MMLVFLFLYLLLPSFVLTSENSNNLTIDEDLDLERQLKLLNKPAIKTIVDNGDIYDCVDINKQPAFDHPSLKHHKLQLRPSSYPIGVFDGILSSSFSSIEIGLKDGGCPSGTVPIKRVTKEDLIRMRSSLKNKKMMHSSSNVNSSTTLDKQEWAVYHTPYNSKDNKYLGASAFITVYGHPQLTSTQFTSSLIFVENDLNPDGSNIIKVGWTVDQSIYGDTKTRLTTSWTRDDFHGTGCIDIRCPGFVQVNKEMPLGANISPLSVYNGVQYGMNFLLLRDTSTSNWWLILKDDLKSIGYWPKEIFTTMSDHANWLSFGGVAGYYGTDSKMPPMGSGHFPFEGVNKSCVFVKVKNINSNSEWVDLPPKDVSPNSHSQCYGLGSFIDTKTSYGNMFYFGGPGGC